MVGCVRSVGSTWKRCKDKDGGIDLDAIARSLAFSLKDLGAMLTQFQQMLVILKFRFQKNNSSEQWFSKCGVQIISISIIWKLVRRAILRCHRRPTMDPINHVLARSSPNLDVNECREWNGRGCFSSNSSQLPEIEYLSNGSINKKGAYLCSVIRIPMKGSLGTAQWPHDAARNPGSFQLSSSSFSGCDFCSQGYILAVPLPSSMLPSPQ